MRRFQLSVAALAIAAVAPMAHAQSSTATPASKLSLDLHVGGMQLSPDEGESKAGANGGVTLGYDVTPALRIGLGMDVGKVDYTSDAFEGDFAVVNFDIGARYAFVAPTRRWAPFLQASVTPRTIGATISDGAGNSGDLTGSGTAFSFGGGLDYSMSRKMAFVGSLNYTMGKFQDWKLDDNDVSDALGDLKANGFRVNVGLAFHPFAK